MNTIYQDIGIACNQYKELQTKIHDITKSLSLLLAKHYSEDRIKQFKDFQEFLDDINEICETDCYAKLYFIKLTKEKYFK